MQTLRRNRFRSHNSKTSHPYNQNLPSKEQQQFAKTEKLEM